MDHLLVAGFDIGRNPSPTAALRERARRSAERVTMRRFRRNIFGTLLCSPVATPAHP